MTAKAPDITKLNLWQRIHNIMEGASYIQKDKKAGMRFSVVSHDKVTALVRPHFQANRVIFYPVDLSMRQDGNRTECKVTVRFVNIDKPDEFFDVPCPGYGVDPQDKGPGKAMSYAVKYAILKTLALETGDDPDESQGPEADHRPAPPKEGSRTTTAPKNDDDWD